MEFSLLCTAIAVGFSLSGTPLNPQKRKATQRFIAGGHPFRDHRVSERHFVSYDGNGFVQQAQPDGL